MALGFLGLVPAVVVLMMGQDQWLPAPAEPVLVDGEGEGQQIVLLRPVATVAGIPVGRRFTRGAGGFEDLD
jgi:hypothetical protein